MSNWVHIETRKVISTQEMINENPNSAFPVPFEPLDGYVALNESVPFYDSRTHKPSFSELATLNGSEWSREISVIELTEVEKRELIPDVCSPAQGLVALFALKSITEDDIQAAIAGISDPVQRYTAQIAFSKATEWRRGSSSTQTLAVLLELTEADLDALFTYSEIVEI